MKRTIIIIRLICLVIPIVSGVYTSHAQVLHFNGKYKATINGIEHIMRLKNNNGIITGNIRNAQVAGPGSIVKAKQTDEFNIKGTQNKRKRRRFIATEEEGEIVWEIKGWFIRWFTSQQERTFRFAKVEDATEYTQTHDALTETDNDN